MDGHICPLEEKLEELERICMLKAGYPYCYGKEHCNSCKKFYRERLLAKQEINIMVTTKTPQKKAEQKVRTARNKANKKPKKKLFRTPEERKRKRLLNKKLKNVEKTKN